MPGIHVDLTGDNSNIVSVFDETTSRMRFLARYIDELSNKGLDFSTSEKSIESLKTHISGLEKKLEDSKSKIEELFEAQKDAMAKGDIDAVGQYGQEIEAVTKQVENYSQELGVASDALATLDSNTRQSNDSLQQSEGIMVKLLGGQEQYNNVINALPPGLKSAVTGLNGMVGAAKAFIATPLGAVLAALILAFKAVTTWMNKSEEGQHALAKISGVLSGIMTALTQVVMNVGKFLYKAFSDPKAAAKDFVNFLKSQVTNRVKAVGEMFGSLGKIISSVFKGKFDDAKEGLADMGKAFVKFNTGIEYDNVKKFAKGIIDTAKASKELEERSFKLKQAQRAWQTEQAELNREIEKAANDMRAGTAAERNSASEKYQELVNKRTERAIELAREEYEIKKAKNALADSAMKDLDEEERLRARIIELEAQGERAKRRAISTQYSTGNQISNEAQQAAQAAEKRRRAEEQLQNELNDLVRSNEDARVDLMEEGGAKQLAVIESNYQKQIEAIERKRAEWAAKNKEASGSEDLLPDQVKALDDAMVVAEMQRDKAINDIHEQSYREFIKAYGDRKQQELLLTEEYNKAIEAADEKDVYARLKIQKDYEKALKELNDKYSASYALIFADASLLSDTMLSRAIEETEKRIKQAKDSNDVQALTQLYARLREQLSEQSGRSEWGFKGLAAGMKELADARKALEDATESSDVDNALADQIKAYDKIKKSVSQVASVFGDLGKALSGFDGVLGGIGTMFSELSAHAADFEKAIAGTATKGDAISSAFSFAIDTASMIASSIQKNKEAQEEWNKTVRQTAHEYAMLKLGALDYKQQNIFGVENPFKPAIDGALQYGKAMEELNKLTAELNKGQVQTGTKKVVDWSNVGKGAASGAATGGLIGSIFGPIGTAIGAGIGALIGGAAGAAATKTVPVFESLISKYDWLYDDETYELNPQIIADYEKLDDTTKQIVDNWQEIADKAKAAEDQMRQNFSDLAGDMGRQLSDSLVNAFRNGALNSAIDDFHSKMTSTIEDIINQMIFSTIFSDMFDDLEKSMMKSFGEGGDNNIVDDIMDFMDNYQNGLAEYDEAMRQAQLAAKERGWDLFKPTDTSATQQNATAGGFQTMSQDTGNELVGRFTALQICGENILQNVISGVDHLLSVRDMTQAGGKILSEIRDAHMLEVGYLEDIAKQTKPILEFGEKLDKIEKNTSKL